MKRFYSLLIMIAILCTVILTACSKTPVKDKDSTGEGIDENKNYTVEFFGWGDHEEQLNYQILIDAFMKKYKNITVVYDPSDSGTYMTKLRNRANNLPDLFYLDDSEFLQWADSGKLLNIRPSVNDQELATIWPEAADKYYYNRDTYTLGKTDEARLYGLPKDLGPFTLVCNETLLNNLARQNNLQESDLAFLSSEEPMDWNQFRALLKKLDTNPNDNIYGISHYEIEAAVYSNNANFFTDDTKTQRITEKNFTDALQFIADLYLVDKVMPSPDDQASTNGYQRFKTGNAVFSFMGPWDVANFWTSVDFDFNVYPVPYGTAQGAKSVAWVGSMSYSVSASSKVSEAAIQLAKYLSFHEDAQRKLYALGQQVPNIIEMAREEYIENSLNLFPKNLPVNRQVFVDTMDGFKDANDKIGGKSRARYYTYDSLWYADFTERLTKLWNGRETAVEIVTAYRNEYQQKLDDMIAQYQS